MSAICRLCPPKDQLYAACSDMVQSIILPVGFFNQLVFERSEENFGNAVLHVVLVGVFEELHVSTNEIELRAFLRSRLNIAQRYSSMQEVLQEELEVIGLVVKEFQFALLSLLKLAVEAPIEVGRIVTKEALGNTIVFLVLADVDVNTGNRNQPVTEYEL